MTQRMLIRRIDPLRASLFVGAAAAVLMFVLAVTAFTVTLFQSGPNSARSFTSASPFGPLVLPFVILAYALVSAATTLIAVTLFNVLAPRLGGLPIDADLS